MKFVYHQRWQSYKDLLNVECHGCRFDKITFKNWTTH